VRQSRKALRFLAVMILSCLSIVFSSVGEAGEISYLPTTDQYLIDAATFREFTTAAFTYEAEMRAWERAYRELNSKYHDTLAAIEKEISAAKVNNNNNKKNVGFGVFGGVGSPGGIVIGVGVVWKMF
jgi:hypothetical protein